MKKISLFLLFLCSYVSVVAQNAADVETSFGPIPGFNGYIYAFAQQADGKILVGGSFTKYKGTNCQMLVRLLPNGNVDPSFILETTFYFKVTSIILQPDGKILVAGGYSTLINGIKDGIIRLNNDGSTDYSFSTITGWVGLSGIKDIVLQPDGKILIAGGNSEFNSISRNGILKLNSDGSLDTTFNPGTGFTGGTVNSIAVQSDGKIIVVGSFTNYNGYTRNGIIRLNPDASVDLSFLIGVGFNNELKSVLIQPDGKIVATGRFTSYKNITQKHIIRLLENGDIDTTLNSGTGFVTSGQGLFDLGIDNLGNFIVSGQFSSYNGVTKYNCIRLNQNGILDNSFNILNNPTIYCVLILNDQKMLLGGNNYMSKLNSNGSLDYTFDYGSGFNTLPGYAPDKVVTAIQPNGKIIVGGQFSLYGLRTELGLIRLNSDGTKDSTFDVSYLDICRTTNILLQPDGKIIISGTFRYASTSNFIKFMRLNTNGSQDMTFSTANGGPGFSDVDYALQSDGKILACSGFQFQVRRLNSNGTVDNTFNTGSGFNNYPRSVTVQPDGKIIVVGDFTLFNGEQHQRIVRLFPNGNLDTSFNTGEGFDGTASTICIQSDGKILIGGNFQYYNVIPAYGIVRINANGSLDATFNAGSNIYAVNSIIVQSDGKIIAGGRKSNYAGNYLTNLIRFNADGSVDTTFDIGTGFDGGDNNSYVSKLHLQSDGKILVSGNFKDYKSIGSANLVRLYGGNSVLSNENFTDHKLVIYPNPAHDYIHLNMPDNLDGFNYDVIDLSGKTLFRNKNIVSNTIDVQILSNGIYFLKVKSKDKEYRTKFIKE